MQPKSHYQRTRFISTQRSRIQRLKEGRAFLIAQPAWRKELERSVLDRDDVDAATNEVESLLRYA